VAGRKLTTPKPDFRFAAAPGLNRPPETGAFFFGFHTMILLVGLGNPGAKYEANRHNVGFMAVDAIADSAALGPPRVRFHAITREGVINSATGPKKVLVMKPQTYMNESGVAVGEAAQFFKLDPSAVVVFHDELDLAPGRYRIKTGGGAAGHNGLRSISGRIGPDYVRARIGIGHPGDKARVLSWVLGDYSAAERQPVADLCDAIARSVDLLVAGDHDAHQNRVAHLAPSSAWPSLPGIGASGARGQKTDEAQ
jgi:peptidyl-tRNA hydrolase, PTH1 family